MVDITLLLDVNAREPLYCQLYQHIKNDIISGKLAAKTRLPSIRALSSHLHISRNTVELAYHQLIAEGYVQSRPRSGLFVIQLEHEKLPAPSPVRSKSFELSKHDRPVVQYDFRYGDVDVSHFPVSTWRKLSNQCLQPEEVELFSYGDSQGEYELRFEITKYLYHSRGVNCSPDQIIIGAGTQYLLGMLSQLVGANGRSIGMEEPGYNGVRAIFQHYGFNVHPIPLDQDGLNICKLYESKSKSVYITPSHQFPYGMVMPFAKRMQLLKWAKEQNGIIIEDDYDSEFRYVGKPIPSLQSLDPHQRTVYLGTFSKCLLPSLRIAYMVLPPTLLELYHKQDYQLYDQTVSRFHQKTLELFMRRGHWEAHIRKMRTVYHKKHSTLIATIHEVMGQHTTVIGQDAGLHILLRVHNGMNESELIHAAAKVGVKVYAVSPFWICPQQADTSMVQIGFGGLSIEDIVKGVHALQRAWISKYLL
ncbi:PLP-dependent aminotransferase family protein [Paenibacillus sp. ACRRX]|uniref:MocR-like pyridoxine biosynthesis transcription factor PdxR n=1 Tax=unclassified Paenibacillus TaxID=185978 RepID=UPI001EF73BC0|nr:MULTISPECIES: PLP-dependent aminotransferase family protein [unclassified Paenibacillus]MCG7408771.1 PLP-dependent aminotransferase family protein [Paenibacillus sp. ACRRX]MDK8183541.1 PLP-dependent aminotransferase family protein [Paenibacillus sp. UMB4589-SE434]